MPLPPLSIISTNDRNKDWQQRIPLARSGEVFGRPVERCGSYPDIEGLIQEQAAEQPDDSTPTKGLTARRAVPAHLGCSGPRRVRVGAVESLHAS